MSIKLSFSFSTQRFVLLHPITILFTQYVLLYGKVKSVDVSFALINIKLSCIQEFKRHQLNAIESILKLNTLASTLIQIQRE